MIPDELIERYLDSMFGNSSPGDVVHNMMFATAGPGELNALGLPDPDKLHVTRFVLAPVSEEGFDTHAWIAQQIRAAMLEARQRQTVPYFVALAVERHKVETDGNEVTENLARRLSADRRLQDHPAVVEVTTLHAACRDGRTWTGEHVLTGANAGKKTGPQLHEAGEPPPDPGLHQRLIRAAVGLT